MTDRERLIELIGEGRDIADSECENYFSCEKCPHGENCEAEFIADHLIANGVTVQKHGRWVKRYLDGEDMSGKPCEIMYACNCSECGLNGKAPTNYCPNCGADMREVKDVQK